MRRRRIGHAAGMLVFAADESGTRGNARSYGITSRGGGLTMTLGEWREVLDVIDRDALRDAVPRVRAPSRARARRRR